MIKLTSIATRPNTGVAWSKTLTQTIINHILDAYISTGKLLCNVTVVGDLQQKGILIFTDQAAVDDWTNDPAFSARKLERDAYNTAHGIVVNVNSQTIDTTDEDYLTHLGFLGYTDSDNNVVSHEGFLKA